MKVRYQHPDMGDEPERDPFEGADIALAARCGLIIKKHYPRLWQFFQVKVEHAQGMIWVTMPPLTGPNGYKLPMQHVQNHYELEHYIQVACDEIIQRYGVRGTDVEAVAHAIQSMPIGQIVFGTIPG